MLSQFSAAYFSRSPVLSFPILALLLFVVVFVAVTVRALRARKQDIDHLAALPLFDQEDNRHE